MLRFFGLIFSFLKHIGCNVFWPVEWVRFTLFFSDMGKPVFG